MSENKLSTEPYKGVRDFYPEEMAIQRYIFDSWSATAESFGFARYDASVLEPAALYKSKGAENEEMVNEQTYTFIDRGDREVTLRPEMTPTVARMVAAKRRELSFPIRWYSIPNLFRYERPQRGRLREHWQLNCDLFGSTDACADVEIIALASQILLDFGADSSMFEIRLNNRAEMEQLYNDTGITDADTQRAITRLNDRFHKISREDYRSGLKEILKSEELVDKVVEIVTGADFADNEVKRGLAELGITNVAIDRSLARGFDYYTGTIFEIFDTSNENNRAMLGGGRYDNLTGMFGGEAISGIGFGMGDVVIRDFLETHGLLMHPVSSPQLAILPTDQAHFMAAQKLAQDIRRQGVSVSVDLSTKKVGKKISDAADNLVDYVIILGEDEVKTGSYTLKYLFDKSETVGDVQKIIDTLTDPETTE